MCVRVQEFIDAQNQYTLLSREHASASKETKLRMQQLRVAQLTQKEVQSHSDTVCHYYKAVGRM